MSWDIKKTCAQLLHISDIDNNIDSLSDNNDEEEDNENDIIVKYVRNVRISVISDFDDDENSFSNKNSSSNKSEWSQNNYTLNLYNYME